MPIVNPTMPIVSLTIRLFKSKKPTTARERPMFIVFQACSEIKKPDDTASSVMWDVAFFPK